ncbi:MAG: bifunctional folylpolyglutamate synthase/dihydrofolate synthase [Bacteroidaceae bacterium]|nr:bifunctional folylpolyglutamate synthase/dihydrofolate synthase [Bacteroidaceae bacterium]
MTYPEAEKYLFTSAPLFQQHGKQAYKPGLNTSVRLDQHFGCPHMAYKTIHVGGTNGKGSVAHLLAAVLQTQGYKVGLYTSPHLLSFRERIRVNGEMIPEERVVRFVEEERAFFEPLHPSFFELATALAFQYFKECHVEVAVVEVGLGGRLDCTNIITPALSVITNVGLDHTDLLGTTLPAIAREKAGIFKHAVPVVVGEVLDDTAGVFRATAELVGAPLFFAQHEGALRHSVPGTALNTYESTDYGTLKCPLTGLLQVRNTRTVLAALRHLPMHVSAAAVRLGFEGVCATTGLRGRWERLAMNPEVVCDTGHNADAWRYLGERIAEEAKRRTVHMVFGMCADKDTTSVLSLLPNAATYYFTQASVHRALPASDLKNKAAKMGLKGEAFPDVQAAFKAALTAAAPDDLIFVGGSTFVVADVLQMADTIGNNETIE